MTKAAPKKKVTKESLRQQMAQSMSGTKPTLVPAFQPKQDTNEALPTVQDLIDDKEDRDTLLELTHQHAILNANKKIMEQQVDALAKRIKVIVSSYGIQKMVCGDTRVSMSRFSCRTINANKLLAQGVDQETIDFCTEVTESQRLVVTIL